MRRIGNVKIKKAEKVFKEITLAVMIIETNRKQRMETNFRTKVFRWAYEIAHTTGKCFAVCLSKAWAIYRLQKLMNKGVVSFTYRKTDGTLRKAQGTLKDVEVFIKGTGKESFKALSYFDVEAAAFRSFRIENLIAIHATPFLSPRQLCRQNTA